MEKYKQTEVGLIPEDWEVKTLDKIGKFSKGSGVKKDEALSGEIPCIRYGEIYTKHNDYIKQFYSFISQAVSNTAKRLNIGDILFAGSGETKEEIGKSVAFINEFEAFAGGDIVILSSTDAEPLYLGYLLNAPFIQKQKSSRGQGDAVVHISAAQLGAVKIPIPPTKAEQTAIATALSDADVLITSLEKLIAKKRMIKQGAMQKLLQPKKGWEVKTVGEIFTFYSTSNFSKAEMKLDGDVGCVHYGLIHAIENISFSLKNGVKYYVTKEQARYEKLQNGDIVMVDASEDLVGLNKSVEISGIGDKEYVAGLHTFHLRDKNSTYIDSFRGLVLNSENVKKQMLKVAVGMKVFGVSKPQLQQILIPIPSITEQTRIATILSDMDAEITALEAKLEKYHKIKLGMMENLLTGKIRLI